MASPEVVRELDQMILVCSFQLKQSILLYSILFYSILFYSILFYSILFYPILFSVPGRLSTGRCLAG